MSVVIVGGGLMGLSAAFHLRRADPGRPVTVLERARVGSAAAGASAGGGQAVAAAARRLGAQVVEGVGAGALVAESGRVVAVEREDGGRQSCDVAIVTAGAWSAILLAALGARLPLETRPLQMLLTEPAPPV